MGISVDGPWCHLHFKDRILHFPSLLSDFEPKGEVARKFGAYDAKKGICERALFVIDENGIIRWSYLSPIGVNPWHEGILDALETINSSFSKQEQGLESRQRVAEEKKEIIIDQS